MDVNTKTIKMIKSILLIPFLALLSCANSDDKTVLFQDAYSAVFGSFAELEIKDQENKDQRYGNHNH